MGGSGRWGVVGGSEAAAPRPFRPHQGKAEHIPVSGSGLLQNKAKEAENYEGGCDDNGGQMIDCAS